MAPAARPQILMLDSADLWSWMRLARKMVHSVGYTFTHSNLCCVSRRGVRTWIRENVTLDVARLGLRSFCIAESFPLPVLRTCNLLQASCNARPLQAFRNCRPLQASFYSRPLKASRNCRPLQASCTRNACVSVFPAINHCILFFATSCYFLFWYFLLFLFPLFLTISYFAIPCYSFFTLSYYFGGIHLHVFVHKIPAHSLLNCQDLEEFLPGTCFCKAQGHMPTSAKPLFGMVLLCNARCMLTHVKS